MGQAHGQGPQERLGQRLGRRGAGRYLGASVAAAVALTGGLVAQAAPAHAGGTLGWAAAGVISGAGQPSGKPTPKPLSVRSREKPPPAAVDAQTLTPAQVARQIKAAGALRADLMRSGAEIAAASSRLERLSAQSNTVLGSLSAARTAQTGALEDAVAQRDRLARLGVQVRSAVDSLGQLASDSYIQGGGPLGDLATAVEALTAPSADRSTDSLATVQYLLDGRARALGRVRLLRSEQALTSARAKAASQRATVAATRAATAKSELDVVIAQQRSALEGFQAAQTAQVARAAGLRGTLLRSENPDALAADRLLSHALGGQDFRLLADSGPSCGGTSARYPNGRLPAEALCPLYDAPGESLRHDAAQAFNQMSRAYQRQTGSALCVSDSYRSYSEQVALKLDRGRWAAEPGHSQHGLGLAVDFCGGVQNFAAPAHLWMQRNAPLFGWFHPGWAEPTGSLPEPWHWEFAG